MENTHVVICPNQDCGENISVPFYAEEGHPGHWSDWDGGYPPEPDICSVDEDFVCPFCGHAPTEDERYSMEEEILRDLYSKD